MKIYKNNKCSWYDIKKTKTNEDFLEEVISDAMLLAELYIEELDRDENE